MKADSENTTILENLKIYLMDLVEVFYLIVNTDMVQSTYKRFVTHIYKDLEEPLLEKQVSSS
jgi:hypothetical protein